MSHPFNEHRQSRVEKSRVSHLVKGYKSGGAVKSGNVTHGAKANREMARMEMEAEGSKAAHRMDRPARAKGGRVKGAKGNSRTIVNVITGGHPAGGAVPPMPSPPPMGIAGPPPGAMPPPMAAKPPMPSPPPGAGPGGPSPMRAAGGRVKTIDALRSALQAPAPKPSNESDASAAARMEAILRGNKAGGGSVKRAKGGRVRRADGGVASEDENRRSGQDMIKMLVPIEQKYGNGMQRSQSAQMKDISSKFRRASGGRVQTPTGTGVAADTGVGSNTGTAVFNASRKSGTHTSGTGNNKDDSKNIGRGRVVSFATGGGVRSFRAYGGRVESPDGVAAATKLPGGSGGGEARLAKEHRAERKR